MQTQNMTRGRPMGLILRFYLPILAGNLFQQLYSFVDSIIVGKGIGDGALAAVGNTGSVNWLILGFATGLTGGLGICLSQSFGAENERQFRRETAASVWICLGLSFVITLMSLLFMQPLFVFLQTPADMLPDTLDYFRIILLGSTVTIFNNFIMMLLRSVGNSKVPLQAMVLSALVNIILDLLFVFPMDMGVEGAALATVLAQAVSMGYCWLHLRRLKNLLPSGDDWKMDSKLCLRLTGKGLPVAAMNSITAVGCLVLQYFVNAMGTAYVAAFAACMKLCSLFEQATGALGLSILTYVGQNYGAGEFDRIRRGVHGAVLLSTAVNLPFALAQILWPEALTSLMLTDPGILALTRQFLPITGFSLFPLGWLFIYRNATQGMGKTVVPMLSGLLEVLCRACMALLLVPVLAFRGVALAEVSAWIGAFGMLFVTFYVYLARLRPAE